MQTLIWIYQEIIKPICAFYLVVYLTPYFIRKAWVDASHNNKKVCDLCFRDIKKWNKKVKEKIKD